MRAMAVKSRPCSSRGVLPVNCEFTDARVVTAGLKVELSLVGKLGSETPRRCLLLAIAGNKGKGGENHTCRTTEPGFRRRYPPYLHCSGLTGFLVGVDLPYRLTLKPLV